MANIVLRRGTSAALENTPKTDGLLAFTVDDGKIHLDYTDENNEIQRRTFYSGVLTFGSKYSYDGTKDVNVDIYYGEVKDTE